jgi:hypothetical protein
MDGDLQYKNGLVFLSVLTKFGTVDTTIASEATTARSAETILTGLVSSEAVLARAAESKLTTDLTAEVKRSTDIDVLFQATDATETAARISADSKLTTDLAFEMARASAAEAVNTTAISTELSRAQAAELVLTNGLAAELVARAVAITAEAKTRSDADILLTTNLTAEGVSRSEGDQSIIADYKAAVLVEKTRAEAAEAALGVRVDFITINVDAKKMDSLAEIVNKVNTVGVDVYARLATIEAVGTT